MGYVFPGVGAGAVSISAKTITNRMFYLSAKTLAGLVNEREPENKNGLLDGGSLYPDLSKIRQISAQVGAAVCREAEKEGLIREGASKSQRMIRAANGCVPCQINWARELESGMWYPEYEEYV